MPKKILIEKNLRLVAHIAKKYTICRLIPWTIIISTGTIGLIKAVNTVQQQQI